MGSSDPVVRLSLTIPTSIATQLETELRADPDTSRSQAVTDAIRLWLDQRRERRLRQQAALLDDLDADDDTFAQLRQSP